MIDQLELALKELIVSELKVIGAKHLVSLERIVPALDGKPSKDACLVLGLLTVKENTSLRDQTFQSFKKPDGRIASKNRAAVKLDLHYAVTASAESPLIERQVLSEALSALFRCQLRIREAKAPETIRFGAKLLALEVAQPDQQLTAQESRVWRGEDKEIKPFFSLVVTLEFNPYEPKEVQLVREAIIGLTRSDLSEKHVGREISMTTASIAGVIVDQHQSPVSEAVVSLEPGTLEASSTSDGVFVFFNLPQGSYQAVVKAPGFHDFRFKAVAPPSGEAGPFDPVVINLEPADTKSIIAADQEAAGLTAEGQRELRPTQLSWVTSAIGRLVFEDGQAAAYHIVRCGARSTMTDGQGFWRMEIAPEDAGSLEVILGPGVTQKLALGHPDSVIKKTAKTR